METNNVTKVGYLYYIIVQLGTHLKWQNRGHNQSLMPIDL